MALKELRRPLFAVDLDDIWLHIALDNVDAADRLLDRIGRVLTMLLDNPNAGRERPELGQGVRSFPVANFTVFYRPTAQHVEFLRALHGARDIGAEDVDPTS